MTGTEVLVRHAMAAADERHPPDRWELGPEGRGAAAELALHAKLGDVAAIVSSTEPKALATAAAFAARTGHPVQPDDRLVEVARPWVGDGYRTAARRYLIGDEPEGWEPRHVVADRFAAAIDDARAEVGDGELLVISHGLSLSLHLEAVFPLPFDVYGFWCRLAFPDAWRIDHEELTLTRVATRESW